MDMEPPDAVFVCRKCWRRMDKDRKRLIAKISWQADKEIMALRQARREDAYPGVTDEEKAAMGVQ
jgi:hypothetical protein